MAKQEEYILADIQRLKEVGEGQKQKLRSKLKQFRDVEDVPLCVPSHQCTVLRTVRLGGGGIEDAPKR